MHQSIRLLRVVGAGNDLHRNANALRVAEPHDLLAPAGLSAAQQLTAEAEERSSLALLRSRFKKEI